MDTQQQRRQLAAQHQDQDQNQVNLFRGLYIGSDLVSHIESIDSNLDCWMYYREYVNSFSFSKHFFQTCFPFSYMSSHTTPLEFLDIYHNQFCSFVISFQLNHPDWTEYTEEECLQHFKDCLAVFIEKDSEWSYTYDTNIATPQTLEKPHYEAYEYIEVAQGEFVKSYVGSGYFQNVYNDYVPSYRRMGDFGPHGCPKFNLETYFAAHDADDAHDYSLCLNNNNKDRFYFCIDGDTDKLTQTRLSHTGERFLFEESFQNEKIEIRREKERKEEKYKQQIKEIQLLNERVQALSRAISRENWLRTSSQAFRNDTPAVIEIQVRFASASILPFQHLNLPMPPVNASDYREPINEFDSESDDE